MNLAILTYNKLPHGSSDDWLAFNLLRQQGFSVEAAIWDDSAINWLKFEAIIVRSCWDYYRRPQLFYRWLEKMQTLGVRFYNPLDVIRWNMDKTYLRDLKEQGVAVPPTVWLEQGSQANLHDLLHKQGWAKAVVKPTVSGTSYRTWLTSPAEAANQQAAFEQLLVERAVMVQQFLPQIITAGEWSLMFFNRQFSHAVVKRAKSGDFRVQNDFGGTVTAETPSPDLLAQANQILARIEAPLLYARIDGVVIDGHFVLMELELFEPHLFLSITPQAPERFAQAVRQLVDSS